MIFILWLGNAELYLYLGFGAEVAGAGVGRGAAAVPGVGTVPPWERGMISAPWGLIKQLRVGKRSFLHNPNLQRPKFGRA